MVKRAYGRAGHSPSNSRKHREQIGRNRGKIYHSKTQPPPPNCGPNRQSIVPPTGCNSILKVSLYHTQTTATAEKKNLAESTQLSTEQLFDVAIPFLGMWIAEGNANVHTKIHAQKY